MSRKIIRQKHNEIESSSDKNDVIDIADSYDGTWHKRGYTSQYGIGIVVDILTGLVIDFEILSKYCPECTTAKRDLGRMSSEFDIWYKAHKPDCSENYEESSNAMEVKAAEILWKRSVKNCEIIKEECLNHVAKRLGTGLRNKVKEWRTIAGSKEGSLKESTILKLTNFYRKAIKENVPDVQKMKTAIFSSLYHSSTTNKSPKHNKCPTGLTSWCFYQRALANNEKPKSHSSMKTKLSEQVLEKILPVYQRLADNELLARMEELIRQGLPGVDEATIENVIEHLKDLGMIYTEDCQYVEEAYLTHLLKPIHVKKLLSFFKKFSSETIAQPNIVYNLEFEEKKIKSLQNLLCHFFHQCSTINH
ncbi:unnamed protein product [Larinioides sclopetarius]|uniref:Mutator-like transposase domain-containing protein n=1 Tax=Larinioides sclopetarius TaxID=280406 RepID=A0AAV2BW46_9ARAC